MGSIRYFPENRGYKCYECNATYNGHLGTSIDGLECLFCSAINKIPTMKLTQSEIEKKKQQIKERTGK